MNLVRSLDREKFLPEIACLRSSARSAMNCRPRSRNTAICLRASTTYGSFPAVQIDATRQIDVVVTVGAGDKMFWGRLAARLAGVPAIISSLHSTGWPDSVGRLNRLLTPLTDAFIGVAQAHTAHLVDHEGFPARKVHLIPNGVETSQFLPADKGQARRFLGIEEDRKVVTILAALRPEKNHAMFISGAAKILDAEPHSVFLIIGDGPLLSQLQQQAMDLGISDAIRFLGSRSDIAQILPASDVVALTSLNEASPVSILEALSCGVPVVAADVGSVRETVEEGVTGKLFAAGDLPGFVSGTLELLADEELRTRLGATGRQKLVRNWSLQSMVAGYEALMSNLASSAETSSMELMTERDLVHPHAELGFH